MQTKHQNSAPLVSLATYFLGRYSRNELVRTIGKWRLGSGQSFEKVMQIADSVADLTQKMEATTNCVVNEEPHNESDDDVYSVADEEFAMTPTIGLKDTESPVRA